MKKIQSIERGMNILAILDSVGGSNGIGVIDMAKLVHLKIPTTHNFLQTFLFLGYVEQTEQGKYRIASKTKWLGWNEMQKNSLIQAARCHLANLADRLNEVTILVARSGYFWQTLLKYESSHDLMIRAALPMTDNFYISATGRCILSQLDENSLADLVTHFRLPLSSEWPGAETLERMKELLAKIDYDGYELYQTDNGVTGVGAVLKPIKDAAPGAIGVIVPTSRFTGVLREAILNNIRETAKKIK